MNRQRAFGFQVAGLLLIAMAIVTVGADVVEAQDWKQFMGEGGSATSESAELPIQWDADTNIKWKSELPGRGASSPIIVGDRIYLTCYTGYGDGKKESKIEDLVRHLLCFNRTSGKILWKKSIDKLGSRRRRSLPKLHHPSRLRNQYSSQ